MADELLNDTTQDDSIQSAANAIEALMNPKPAEAAPAQAAAPANETPQDSPQAAAQDAPEAGNTAVEAAPAVDADTPAIVPTPPPATLPVSSPELDQARQEANRKAQEAETARNQFVTALNTLVPQLEAQIRGEFADIKTNDDLVALADPRSDKYNPDRYNAFQAQLMRLNNARQTLQAGEQKAQQEQQAKIQEFRIADQQKLFAAIPELKDPEKGPVIRAKLEAAGLKQGYTREELSQATSRDWLTIQQASRAVELEAQLTAAKAKAANAPPVQQPGTQRPNANKDDKLQTDFERLQKTGRTDDAASVFNRILAL